MALYQKEHCPYDPLTAEQMKEIAEYEKIIAFHDLIVSGKHPRIKLDAGQIADARPRDVTRASQLIIPIREAPRQAQYAAPQDVAQGVSGQGFNNFLFDDAAKNFTSGLQKLRRPVSFYNIQRTPAQNLRQPHPNDTFVEPQFLQNSLQSENQRPFGQAAFESHFDDTVVKILSQQIIPKGPSKPIDVKALPANTIHQRVPLFSASIPTGPKALRDSPVAKRHKPNPLSSTTSPITTAPLQKPSNSTKPVKTSLQQTQPAIRVPTQDSQRIAIARLDYTRDYYSELGVTRTANKNELVTALLKDATPRRREAYDVLTDDYLKVIYDDARAFRDNQVMDVDAGSWGGKLDVAVKVNAKQGVGVSGKPSKKRKRQKQKAEFVTRSGQLSRPNKPPKKPLEGFDMRHDYYKDLGCQPGTPASSIARAFRYKAKAFSPNEQGDEGAKAKWKSPNPITVQKIKAAWARTEKAFAVLGDVELRSKYDMQRVVVKSTIGYEKALEIQKKLKAGL